MEPNAPWYEFVVGALAGTPLRVHFQVNETARVLRGAPRFTTKQKKGRLLIAKNLFIRHVIIAAARRMSINSTTAMTGLPWLSTYVDGMFNEWLIS